MIQNVLQESSPDEPRWVDVVDPSKTELDLLAQTYSLHATSVQDCLQPMHLPKHELLEDTTFLIIRSYDETCQAESDTVQAMTRKLAFFLGNHFLISIHRQDQLFLQNLRTKYQKKRPSNVYLQVILLEILMAAVETYHKPLEDMEERIQLYENAVLTDRGQAGIWEDIFRTKCRLMVIKRMLWHSLNTVQKFIPYSSANLPLYQDLKERIESLQFFADSLLDELNNLLNIQISLASNRTNEVMRVLTVFSVFFMPLHFIVGLYGMNFEFMPEVHWRYGYFLAWGMILGVTSVIYVWFRKKKLL